MRKFLSIFAASIFLASNASLVDACDHDNEYKKMMKYINNKQTFVYYLSAWDCDKCQSTKLDLWQPLTNNNNRLLHQQIDKILEYNTQLGGDQKKSFENLHIYSYQMDQKAKAFDNDNVKKMMKYIIKQFETRLNRKNMKKEDTKISSLPLFLYFDRGVFEGYIQHEFIKNNHTGFSPIQLFNNTLQQLIIGHNFSFAFPNEWPFHS